MRLFIKNFYAIRLLKVRKLNLEGFKPTKFFFLNVKFNVGARRGKPVIFQIDAAAMSQAGYQFYCSENGVWLVDDVPPEYLNKIES
jgi:hypothetical protein